jgi:mannose-6-phosphate isomerase
MTRTLIAAVALFAAGPAFADDELAAEGKPAPMFRLPVYNAKEVGATVLGLDKYIGAGAGDKNARVVMLSFMASFCAPCKKEMPYLQSLHEKYGPKLGVLVKIFDVGDGAHIPVHWHPSPEFARQHLKSPFGKNECWIVIGTRPGAKAWVGWKEDVGEARFRQWMEAQDVDSMRAHLHEIEPKVGDIVFLRDGYVHSLGSGLCVLEPQEPSDWNILAEWKGYPYGKEDAHCGLGWDLALKAARFDAMAHEYLNGYVRRQRVALRARDGAREENVLPEEARRYFWFTRLDLQPGSKIDLPGNRGFYCLIGVGGKGELRGGFGTRPISRGKSYFIAANLPGFDLVNAGKAPLEAYCCYPPAS